MKTDLKTPCEHCPFRKGQSFLTRLKNGFHSQMVRIMGCLGQIAEPALDLVYDSIGEMADAHEPMSETGETCSVVNDDCLAPAGYMGPNGVEEGTEFVETCCYNCGEYVCENCSREVDGRIVCDRCEEE